LQVADVLVVDVEVDEGAELAVVGVEMAAEFGMLDQQGIHGFSYGYAVHFNRGLLAYVLPQGSGYMNLAHDVRIMMPRRNGKIQVGVAGSPGLGRS
jgi:hypothetical protein